MTASEIAARAIARIDDDPVSPVSVTMAEVYNRVNEGYLLASVLTLFLVKTVYYPLSGCWHTPRTILPDLIVPLRITVFGVRLRPSTLSELDAWLPAWQATPGTALRYAAVGSNLLAVVPQETVTAQITYAASPPALAPADTPLLPSQYHPALVEWTTYRLRLKEGAQQLARGLGNLNLYLDAMTELGQYMRTRSAAAHFDVAPFELALYDRSKLVDDIIKRQARAAAKQGATK